MQRYLEAKGLKITTSTIVDTTAPSSTKNPPKRAKGNQWYFGLKAHFGVDSCSKSIHAALVTSANVADSATGLSLPAGGDPAQAPKARDFINRRYRHRGVVDESERAKNRAKSKVRAKIEHSIASHKAPLLSEMRHDFLGK